MSQKNRMQGCCSAKAASSAEVAMPNFTIVPLIGRKPLDEIPTDLVLMTKLNRMAVPEDLHVRDLDVAQALKQYIKDFPGRAGTHDLYQVRLPNSQGALERYILLAGLGSFDKYDASTACRVFQTLIEQALELGVSTITVPFIPNPMTKEVLSHKATAYKLKDITRRVLARHEGPVNLREIQLYCTPNAVRHLQDALGAESGPGCCCRA